MMTQYDGPNVIANYHLAEKFTSKCIQSIDANTNKNLFIFSTNSLKKPNEIHLIQFDEETSQISNNIIFSHPGVIHKVFPNPKNEQQFFTAFSEYNGTKETHKLAYWDSDSTQILTQTENKITQEKSQLKNLIDVTNEDSIHSVVYLTKEDKALFCDKNNIKIHDFNKQETTELLNAQTVFSADSELSLTQTDPHHSNIIANVSKNNILFYDLRDKKSNIAIDSAHNQQIFDIDYNPNKQYHLLSCGDDCLIKFWEIRKPSLPLKVVDDLQNWVLSCKFNKYHDQLILSSGDNGSVNLHKIISTSSAPILNKYASIDSPTLNKNKDEDGLIKSYYEHEESIYSVAWSAASAWIFASVSYNGSVIINMVPASEKYRILL